MQAKYPSPIERCVSYQAPTQQASAKPVAAARRPPARKRAPRKAHRLAPRRILNWRSIQPPRPARRWQTRALPFASHEASSTCRGFSQQFILPEFGRAFNKKAIPRTHSLVEVTCADRRLLCLHWSCHVRQMLSRAVLTRSRIGLVRTIRRTKGLVIAFTERDIAARLGGGQLTVRRDLRLRPPGPGIIR